MIKEFGVIMVAVIYLAALFVLVRPNSQGPTLVGNIADGLTNLIKSGTGGGAFTASGK